MTPFLLDFTKFYKYLTIFRFTWFSAIGLDLVTFALNFLTIHIYFPIVFRNICWHQQKSVYENDIYDFEIQKILPFAISISASATTNFVSFLDFC